MSWIRVISTKVARPVRLNGHIDYNCFVTYVNKLSNAARTNSGFIESDSHWKGDQYDTIVSISTWSSKESWDNWLYSTTRGDIHNKYKTTIYTEKHDILRKRKKSNNIHCIN